MSETPSLNGRDNGGRFVRGNSGGPGNPFSDKSNQLRAVIYAELKPSEMRGVARALIAKAKGGDVPAARVLIEWTIQKPADDPMSGPQAPDPARAAAAIMELLRLPAAPLPSDESDRATCGANSTAPVACPKRPLSDKRN